MKEGTHKVLQKFDKALVERDKAFEDLKGYALASEMAAMQMKKAFGEMRNAFNEESCYKVHQKAEEHGEQVPFCWTAFHKGMKGIGDMSELIKPDCSVGAIRLKSLQDADVMAQEASPLALVFAGEAAATVSAATAAAWGRSAGSEADCEAGEGKTRGGAGSPCNAVGPRGRRPPRSRRPPPPSLATQSPPAPSSPARRQRLPLTSAWGQAGGCGRGRADG